MIKSNSHVIFIVDDGRVGGFNSDRNSEKLEFRNLEVSERLIDWKSRKMKEYPEYEK